MNVLLIVIGLIIAFGLFLMSKYNGIIVLKNKRDQSFSDIDVRLKQRFDLIPQLIETVKGYMGHEKSVLESITKARTGFMNAKNIDEKIAADNMLTGTLKTLFAVAENYPDLKASTNFQQLQNQMSSLEGQIATSRNYFNETTTAYNTYIQVFPTNIVAGIFGFKTAPLFEAAESREILEKAPEVKF